MYFLVLWNSVEIYDQQMLNAAVNITYSALHWFEISFSFTIPAFEVRDRFARAVTWVSALWWLAEDVGQRDWPVSVQRARLKRSLLETSSFGEFLCAWCLSVSDLTKPWPWSSLVTALQGNFICSLDCGWESFQVNLAIGRYTNVKISLGDQEVHF